MVINELRKGMVLTNNQLMEVFGCSGQGGMRRAHKTNSLVLVSNHTKSIYSDRWVGDVLHYTGMGQSGDQSLQFAQNRTLNESRYNGVSVYLFEVFQQKKYTYIGEVELADKPYLEVQLDSDRKERKVVIFPLKLKEENR